MPKITLNRKHRNEPLLLAYIRGAMNEQNITQSEMADYMGVTQQCLSKKFKNGTLTVTDLLKILDRLKPDDNTLIKLMRG